LMMMVITKKVVREAKMMKNRPPTRPKKNDKKWSPARAARTRGGTDHKERL
jgi:hypothetical protein